MVEHQGAFIQALRSGHKMRKRMFDTIEQRHKHDFVSSRMGMGFYEDLLSAVRVSGVPEAVEVPTRLVARGSGEISPAGPGS